METNGFDQKSPEGIIESINRKGSTNHRFVLPFLGRYGRTISAGCFCEHVKAVRTSKVHRQQPAEMVLPKASHTQENFQQSSRSSWQFDERSLGSDV